MGRKYAGIGNAAVGTNLTILAMKTAATVRPELFELNISCGATPADLTTIFHLERFTAIGTEGGGFTPVALDPNDPASLCDYGTGVYSGEPTYTASAHLLNISVHQRAIYRWIAAPSAAFKAPATANNGIGLQSQSSGGTASHTVTMLHEE
jgi:hypothetical protein